MVLEDPGQSMGLDEYAHSGDKLPPLSLDEDLALVEWRSGEEQGTGIWRVGG